MDINHMDRLSVRTGGRLDQQIMMPACPREATQVAAGLARARAASERAGAGRRRVDRHSPPSNYSTITGQT